MSKRYITLNILHVYSNHIDIKIHFLETEDRPLRFAKWLLEKIRDINKLRKIE